MEKEEIDYGKESILVVDDEADIRETLADFLSALGFSVGSACDGIDALKKMKEEKYTFLVTDMKMPKMDGMELIKKTCEEFPDVSVIAVTGHIEGYRYIDVINSGASDFIKKPFEIDEMEAKVRRIINERNLRKKLSWLSITDSLTGLYNQGHFYKRLESEVKRAQRQKKPITLILLDLDNFKVYNDSYGHLAGDEVLKNVGKIIQDNIRKDADSGYRYGGDEFAIILIDTDLIMAQEIGQRIQYVLKENNNISVSIGYTRFSGEMSFTDLVAEADKDLYRAKAKSKNNNK